MKCPFCRHDDDHVIDSRVVEEGTAIRRRRKCNHCGRRFTTFERLERRPIKVVKRDGTRVPFDRNKLKTGLEKACWKRPVSDAQLEQIVNLIEQEIETDFESEVESRHIGELAMQHLRDLDQVAYVRFASVYRRFEDAVDFVEEIRPMLRRDDALRPPLTLE